MACISVASFRVAAVGGALLALGACSSGEAPDFTLRDLAGNEISLSELRGKVVLLSFWGLG